ncbi:MULTISPECIES: metallophosphoesterase [Halorubrum]|uniref:Metallophosphoesterase n=1 Tax=Halorubrum hochstenium ATCC 700873 TaxID=1227481 RepID=M0FK34_9EURY|nr:MULTISPECIES: metallophosphoesterase [Halorubrum]ELZ59673.1 metallophosphoesterase [Halorubrum hochstenium ATCC 700873]
MGTAASPAVEPVVGEPAAVADLETERALLVADVHAGVEVGLRYERGVELDSRADARRERLVGLLAETDADRLVVLGDLAHRIGAPDGDEREELETLVRAVTDRVPMTLVEGNHDAGVAEAFADDLDVIDPAGGLLGAESADGRGGTVGVVHGHTWPDPALLDADVVCMGHEHPQVRLEDAVGGSRVERAWLRGPVDPTAFVGDPGPDAAAVEDPPELVIFPAFNERSGGTWVNVEGQSFLAPFLPDTLPAGDAYLLDGTRLGDYRRV